jgi:ankyrin repeat protein
MNNNGELENSAKLNDKDLDNNDLLESYDIDNQSIDSEDSDDIYTNQITDNQFLYFLKAVKDDNIEYLENMIKEDTESKLVNRYISQKDEDGILPLQYAVLFGNTNMIDKLVSLGANKDSILKVYHYYIYL